MTVTYLLVGNHYLEEEDSRLDARYYHLALRVRWELERSRWPVRPLRDWATFTYLGRFKRSYVPEGKGIPFVGGREVFFWPPRADKYLHPDSVQPEFFPRRGDILVTRSGTVGHAVLAGSLLTRFGVSEHLLRVHPKELKEAGYLYAFLRSRYGYNYAQGAQFGAVVKELNPNLLGALPVPILPKALRNRLHKQMMIACELRDEGAALFQEATEQMYTDLRLPQPSSLSPESLPLPAGRRALSFVVKARELEGRLDASYHHPQVEAVLRGLRKGRYRLVELKDVSRYITIPPRFKRYYVAKRHGLPFLRPSDLSTMRVLEKRFIAGWIPEVKTARLSFGEILVARSGSIGDIGFVTKALENWIGSDDLAHVMVEPTRAHPGYVLAFLSSPYGQIQIKREIYGGVIDHLEVHHLEGLQIPLPPPEVQTAIGDKMLRAYELRDKANTLEDEAIAEIETAITRGPEGCP